MNEQNVSLKYAMFWKRAIALFIDLSITIPLFCFLIFFVNYVLALPVETSLSSKSGLYLEMTPYVKEHFIKIVLLYSFLKLAVLVPYFTLLESSSLQATLGKWMVGIKVTDLTGHRISFKKSIIRFFAKILSGQILAIGFLMAAFTERKQALHDFLAKTIVVSNKT
jgi:uncharacterized RDD family membrane protein YckC